MRFLPIEETVEIPTKPRGFQSLMTATPSEPSSSPNVNLAEPGALFQPPWIFRNGHIQTLAGTYLFGRTKDRSGLTTSVATVGEVLVDDGDRLVFHDECPENWRPGDRVALLLHGLAGSHASPYMQRIANQLCRENVRTFRLDWRGCGAGMSLARLPYHSGRSDDLRAVITAVQNRCPASPICLIGFSMGGNVALKLLGESSKFDGVIRAVAVCPPIDLSETIEYINTGLARWYDAYFAKTCIRNVQHRQLVRPDAIVPEGWFARPPRSMREFDETFTAPVCGFASAADYYSLSSAKQFLPGITVPTLIIAAQDDPVVPFGPFANAALSPTTELRAPKHGGQLGFVTANGPTWLDRQVIDWTIS